MMTQHQTVHTVTDRLDATRSLAHRTAEVRPARVRLDGDGWLDITGRLKHVRAVADDLLHAPDIGHEIRERHTNGVVTIRFAHPTNHYAFRDV